jgi:hypothetical protein
MKQKFIIGLVFMWIMGTGCEKEYYYGPENQPVYFEHHYINHAWGVADRGWMIDNEGRIRGYDRPENYRWPDSTGHLSFEDLEYNLSQTDTLLFSLNRKELEMHTRLIGGAADGALSDRTQRGADMGSGTLSCYIYDPATGSYKHVLLTASGDWEQSNQSAEAEKLLEWLTELDLIFP